MIEKIQIIHPDYFVRYHYTSDNSFDKHFYVTFGVHVVGKKKSSLVQWLTGSPSKKEYNDYVEFTFYLQRVKWYNSDGNPASVDEAVALNLVKNYIDSLALSISEKKKRLSQRKGKCGEKTPQTVHISQLNWAA